MTKSKHAGRIESKDERDHSQINLPIHDNMPLSQSSRSTEHIDSGNTSNHGDAALIGAQLEATNREYRTNVEILHKAHVAAQKREGSLYQVKEQEIRRLTLVERTEMERTAGLQRQVLWNESAARIRMIEQGRERKPLEKGVGKTTVNIGGVDVD
jgi:hypothetical protein